jgi:hypothetical protein
MQLRWHIKLASSSRLLSIKSYAFLIDQRSPRMVDGGNKELDGSSSSVVKILSSSVGLFAFCSGSKINLGLNG